MSFTHSLLRVVLPMLFLCAVLLAVPGGVEATSLTPATGSWTILDAPGSFYTRAFGISGTTIVGDFGDASGYHGFRYDGTTWTTLDAPGSRSTTAYGIDGNNIVGYFNDESGRDHGFLYNGTTWQTLDAPGVVGTYAYGISGNNIVGYYHDASGTHGFLYDGATWQTLDVPGAVGTYAFGIFGNTVVGRYDSGGVSHGFLYDGTTWTTLDAPGSTFTAVQGVLGDTVVGAYSDASASNGFIRKGTQWSSLAASGARFTMAMGISGNNVVGYYNDASNSGHGFLFRLEDDDSCSVIDIKDSDPNGLYTSINSKKHLVVITHGWADREDDPDAISLMNTMRDNICEEVDKRTTTVLTYNWTLGSGTGTGNFDAVVGKQYLAYNLAHIAGHILATDILGFATQPEHIHFIAHSAGSNVIQNAVHQIAQHYGGDPKNEVNGNKAPQVRMTFLDAFAPTQSSFQVNVQAELFGLKPDINAAPMGREQDYGNLYGLIGYAEQYVDASKLQAPFDDYTDIQLRNATNFDVTYLDSSSVQGGDTHMWPVHFYNKSIIDREYVLPISADKNVFKLGFPFSIESTQNNKTAANIDEYKGDWCIVTNVSEPYRRCLDYQKDERRDVILTDNNPSAPYEISGSGTLVDVSQFIGHTDGVASGTLPPITMKTGFATIEIPYKTTATSSVPGWSGILSAPNVVTIPPGLVPGIGIQGVKVGIDDPTFAIVGGAGLTFSRGVRIELVGQAGNDVGYTTNGTSNFTPILDTCSSDTQSVGDALPEGGDCKISLNNGNLVIWTKHLTTFVTYEESLDVIAPTTTLVLAGNGGITQYFSNVVVTLTATDTIDGSGVASTTYSLDNGTTWLQYTEPFEVTTEGEHTILYRSIDFAGNLEETKSVTFTIVLDTVSPVTTLSTTGTGGPEWFRSDIEVTLSATDDKTGVASTTYSLDDGTTWLDYSAPFTITGEGQHTVLYRSTDKAGNTEDTKTATLYIDLTAPEARISANILSKDLLVAGKDNMGSTTVLKTTTGYTIADEAGHATKLTFKKSWNGKVLTFAQLTGIQYDSASVVTLPKTQLLYVWTPPTGTSNLTNQTVHVNKTFTVNATYVKPLNRTIVTVAKDGKIGKPQTFSGLKLVTLTTANGVIGYEL
ncbi:MAG: hypothetical protein KBD24_01215 [Candidatus Pacebacteria bacterium]|nr:hypothetical protein [Candidatus Paceibacterota bacterium]